MTLTIRRIGRAIPRPAIGALWAGLAMSGCTITVTTDDITPEYADSAADTYQNKVVDGGVTGRFAVQNTDTGQIRTTPAKLRISPDRQTAFLEIDGIDIRLEASPSDPATASSGTYLLDLTHLLNAAAGFDGTTYLSSVVMRNFSGQQEASVGILGALTRPEQIEALSSTASYEGSWFVTDNGTTTGDVVTIFDSFEMAVDFAAGSDQVTATFEQGDVASDFGTLTATVGGNSFVGQLVIDPAHPDLSGALDVSGAFFGPTAEEVGGILYGDIDSAADGEMQVTGNFLGQEVTAP